MNLEEMRKNVWMDEIDIKHIEDFILTKKDVELDVLEWGSGWSTLYFSKFIEQLGNNYKWTSLEYNLAWFNKIAEYIENLNVAIFLFDVGNNDLFQRDTNMDKYVDYPLNFKFDMVIVDGRKRRRCLLNAAKILKPGGTVFLHDAERNYYHCAFKEFKNGKFLSKKLWSGSI